MNHIRNETKHNELSKKGDDEMTFKATMIKKKCRNTAGSQQKKTQNVSKKLKKAQNVSKKLKKTQNVSKNIKMAQKKAQNVSKNL